MHPMTAVNSFYRWRDRAGIAGKIMLTLGFALCTGLAAQLRVPLPWTPVPLTGQTLMVVMSGVMLGRWGGVSQLLYVSLGAAGVPWFTGMRGGAAVLFSPTGGYLIGFIAAAWLIGILYEKYPRTWSYGRALVLFMAAESVLILGTGTACLAAWLTAAGGTPPGLLEALSMGFFPFIPGMVVKSLIAAGMSRLLGPPCGRGDFNR